MLSFLIVSAEPQFAKMIQLGLELHGYKAFHIVSDTAWPDENFDLVFIDMQMWNDLEIELAEKILKKAAFKNVKTLLVLPRGHAKPPSHFKATAVAKRPFELVGLIKSVEDLVH